MRKKVDLKKEKLILELYKIGAIKFGRFTLKSGRISPYYLDFRFLCSYPKVLREIAAIFNKALSSLKFDVIAAVPYTAIPIATAIALFHYQRMIFSRKEVKEHGTRKLIEGIYKPNERAVIIDDVISDGASKLEVIEPLEAEGLKIKDVVVFLDRGQGGPQIMKGKGYRCHAVLTIDDVLEVLLKHKKITEAQVQEAYEFLGKASLAISPQSAKVDDRRL